MKKAWNKVQQLRNSNAMHRKGKRMQEMTLEFLLERMQEELDELKAEPDDPVELADMIGVAFHYAIKQGWTWEFMQSLMMEKFELRFSK